ncbi:MAG: ParB/RepB/Spo0J family partition protein [Ignavibacteriae bacterium]|nr:ParB/RepB/Spo0J family partition protein [Ignavibacteriota bacterium]
MSKAKGGLGKGLSALIRPVPQVQRPAPDTTPIDQAVERKVDGLTTHIEIAKIRPNPYQPRADFDQQALDELKESIKQKGIIQPVTVRRGHDGMYELISGERRIRASTELGLQTIPAYVIEVKRDEEMLELALIENLQREHLNPIEIAISYQRLSHDVGLTAEEIAQKVSKDRTTVVNFLRLLKLPAKIQDALRKGSLTMGHARALVSLPDERVQLRFFERIVKKDLNVRQVEKLVRDYGKKTETKVRHLPKGSLNAAESVAESMQKILATKVRVNVHDSGRGEIVIEFYNSADLERLFDLIASIEQ